MDLPDDLDGDAINDWYKRRLEKALDDYDDCMDKAAGHADKDEECFERFKERKKKLKQRYLRALSI